MFQFSAFLLKVLFTIAGLHPESGGPSHSVPALCQALGRADVEVEIVSLHYGDTFGKPLNPSVTAPSRWGEATDEPAALRYDAPRPARECALPTSDVHRTNTNPSSTSSVRTTFVDCSSAWARRTQWTPAFKSVLRERCVATGAQIIHDTGLWLLTNHAAAEVCKELNLPRIVSPRGMLTASALQHKGWKKRIAWTLYQRRDLRTAHVLHATSPAEVQDFRAAGLTQPVAMIPNGVALPFPLRLDRGEGQGEVSNVPCLPPSISHLRTILFLSRIHPIKGLPDLIKAWALVKPTGWRVVIAGMDEGRHAAELKAEIRNLKLENDFEFVGPVAGEGKWSLYGQADLFVLPSHSENFGIVVAEALASGVPVITTRATPWEDLVTHRCGWWTENGPEPLAAALRDALSRTDEERREMGNRGRLLVEQKYSWPGIGAQMHAVYCWMLGQGAKPDCVLIQSSA